jgi:alpha-tubulin suppressor-like RCC1 family protein
MGSQVQCWGHGQYGPLGDGNTNYITLPPVIFGVGGVTAVSAGYDYTLALLSNQTAAASGSDYYDNLGHPSGEQNSPVAVITPPVTPDAGVDGGDAGAPVSAPLGGITRISAGALHGCAIHSGTVACWGSSGSGESGVTQYSVGYPFDVTLPATATEIGAGYGHTCAILSNKTVQCWGSNGHGQLGGAGGDGPSLRQPNLGGKTPTALALGDNHTCVLTSDGTVMCWGDGSSGQIGNGVLSDTPTPTAVTGLTNIVQISAKADVTCAVSMTGVVSCWGDNESGELGNGTVLSTGTPAAVAGY